MSSSRPTPQKTEEVAASTTTKVSEQLNRPAVSETTGNVSQDNQREVLQGSWLDPSLLKETHTYFNNTRKHSNYSEYERLFHLKEGYEKRLHRDDRANKIGLNISEEERNRKVPVLSSSVYGSRPSLEEQCREHVIIESVNKGFFRCRGTNIPSSSQGNL